MDDHPHLDINEKDIRSVQLYRSGIVLSALAFVIATTLLIATRGWQSLSGAEWIGQHRLLLYTSIWMLVIGTGLSIFTIHLYIRQFHIFLKILFGIGVGSLILFLAMGGISDRDFLQTLYHAPYGTLGFGFVLAALCGIAVKEAFCFGQIEAVLFATVTPVLILGHIFHMLSPQTEFILLNADTLLICIFAIRKVSMPVDLDIGDKSVYM